ncbi:hypothetical protein GCM10023319_73220 [Nocardia iowensis]
MLIHDADTHVHLRQDVDRNDAAIPVDIMAQVGDIAEHVGLRSIYDGGYQHVAHPRRLAWTEPVARIPMPDNKVRVLG